ncbi:hypothetical protein H1Q63_29440 [Desmonostoc muscorum CCALA 125]|nr:hypothetical protein [Desmonostoc muscorum CCALA 125]
MNQLSIINNYGSYFLQKLINLLRKVDSK